MGIGALSTEFQITLLDYIYMHILLFYVIFVFWLIKVLLQVFGKGIERLTLREGSFNYP